MAWLRSLFAEIFPQWHERRLLREFQAKSEANLDALQRYRRKLAMGDKLEQQPKRGTREQPTPATGKGTAQKPPAEVPPIGEHVPEKSPERASKGGASRSEG